MMELMKGIARKSCLFDSAVSGQSPHLEEQPEIGPKLELTSKKSVLQNKRFTK